MYRVILLGFLVFAMSYVVVPAPAYAISLDDEEEDSEDVADLLEQAKKAAKSESFSKANTLLKKAKMYGVNTDEVKEVSKYIATKKRERDARIEKERKEKERLARLKREKEERARRARLARQRQQSSGGYSSSGGSIQLCVPSVPSLQNTSEYSAKTASGRYATVRLRNDLIKNCFTLSVYGGNGYGGGNTCAGAYGDWSVTANGNSGYVNGLSSAVAWILRRL